MSEATPRDREERPDVEAISRDLDAGVAVGPARVAALLRWVEALEREDDFWFNQHAIAMEVGRAEAERLTEEVATLRKSLARHRAALEVALSRLTPLAEQDHPHAPLDGCYRSPLCAAVSHGRAVMAMTEDVRAEGSATKEETV